MSVVGMLALLLACSAVLAVFLAVVVGPRRTPGALPFLGLMLSAAIWSGAYGFELASTELERVLFWLRVEYLGIPLVGAFWLLVTLEILSRPPRRARAAYLLLLPPLGFAALAWTNDLHGWFHVGPALTLGGPLPLLRFDRGPAYWANWGYAWLLLLVGFIRLVLSASGRPGVHRRQAFFLIAAMAVPAALNGLYAIGIRPWGALDLTPFGFLLGGFLLLWGVFHASLFSLVPTARAHVFERIPDGILVGDERGWLMDANPAAERMLGPLAMNHPIDASPGVWPSLRMELQKMAFKNAPAPATALTSLEYEATVSAFGDPRRGRGVVAVVRDVRERKRAEWELRHRERLLSVLSEVARLLLPARGLPDLDAIVRLLGQATHADRTYVAINEFREDGALCMAPAAVWNAKAVSFDEPPPPPDRMLSYDEAGLSNWRRRLAAGDLVFGRAGDFAPEEMAFLAPRNIRVLILIPLFTEEGFAGLVGCERRRDDALWSGVEQEFLRSASLYLSLALRRQRTEDALRQSQKLDTMGRLASGIAHDFNNLLQVINGYADMALIGLGEDDPRTSDLREVLKAGQRAAALTQQLLSFSRRQALTPKPHDLHTVVSDMRAMLKRLLGERVTLELRFEAREPVVDVAGPHIEQIVMNLAVNARDAMADGGVIRISTRNLDVDAPQSRARGVPEGRYVLLYVEDSGAGMSADVMSHIFEPFFTTKPRGRGTGLGLATVYGLVRQHQGHVSVQSTIGQGTQFTILLPVSRGVEAKPEGEVQLEAGGEGGTLLVVEDELSVRRLWVQVLSNAGYTVLEADSGEAALDAAHAYGGPIDALISDVVMSGLSGNQIAMILTAERPDLKVLLISGYPDDAETEEEQSGSTFPLLSKPVPSETLIADVRNLLRKRVAG